MLHWMFFNPVLVTVFIAWLVAQSMKFLIEAFKGKVNIYNFITTGGMPSGHSAVVSALATAVGLSSGFDSPLFGISIALAIIVMHDAVVIRGAAGKQASILNKLIDKYQEEIKEHHLKVRLGHTPLEVAFGSLLGIIIALLVWDILYV